MKLLSLFSGIGAFESALDRIGLEYELVNYCEIDKYASKSYAAIHGVSEEMNLWDVTKVDTDKLPKDIDLVTYGFPCQDISNAGKMRGFTDEDGNRTRSGLFFEALRIIEETQPRIAIAENVKNLTGKKFKNEFEIVLNSLEEAGYNNYWKVLNASDYNVPQSRERVFIVSIRKDMDTGVFEFPQKLELKKCMMDYLEEDVDEKYFLSDKMFAYVLDLDEKQQGTKWEGRANNDFINPRIAHTLSVRGIKGQRAGVSNIICVSDHSPVKVADYKKKLNGRRTNDHDLRNITERECFRLMGFADKDFKKAKKQCNNSQLLKQAGNSIVVDVIEHIYKSLEEAELI